VRATYWKHLWPSINQWPHPRIAQEVVHTCLIHQGPSSSTLHRRKEPDASCKQSFVFLIIFFQVMFLTKPT
jgi:hypothetical protein